MPNGTVSKYKKVLGLTTGVGVDRDGATLVSRTCGDAMTWRTPVKVLPARGGGKLDHL